MRPLTENGFTEEFEDGVPEAEKATENVPFHPAKQVIKELAIQRWNLAVYLATARMERSEVAPR